MSDTPRPDVDEIRQDIERTRRELGDTAEALAYKANVSARAKEKATEVLDTTKAKAAVAKDTVKAKAEQAMHVAHVKAEDASQQAQKTIDNLPEPAARRARGIIVAIQRRPGVFIAGAVVSIAVLRRIARGRKGQA